MSVELCDLSVTAASVWSRVVIKEMEAQMAEVGDDVKTNASSSVKPLHRLVIEHQDVAKLAMQLGATVLMHRIDVNDLLTVFSGYDQLWTTVLTELLSVACQSIARQ